MLKKISMEQIRAGMYVHELGGSWLDNPFWASSFILRDDADLQKLRASGIEDLWIDTSKGADVLEMDVAAAAAPEPEAEPEPTPAPVPPPPPSAPGHFRFEPQAPSGMREELVRAAKVIHKSRDAVSSMFEDIRLGKLVDAAQATPIVEEIANSVLRNAGALLSLVRIKQADDYTYLHSVAVSAMMIALARQLNMSDAEVRDCGLAGLLHDIGKVAVPSTILNKPGRLSDEEFQAVKGHPRAGHALLQEVPAISPAVLDVCLHHHERVDGNGYPDRLSGTDLSRVARMGAICDVYDAITSNRPYKEGWSPAVSLRKMALWTKEGHLDEALFAAFVKCVGIYPVGTLVRLKSDRLAVVVDNGETLLSPTVNAFYSVPSRVFLEPKLIDLARPDTIEKIVSVEEPQKWPIRNFDRFWLPENLPAHDRAPRAS